MKLNKIFISHGKKYTTSYYTMEKWLNESMKNAGDFSWVNCSAPNNDEPEDPDDNAYKKLLINEIRNQIRNSSIFIIISDMYCENKKLLDLQISAAKQDGKYIIGLKPWRNLKPVPKKILKIADEMVNLCSSDLINSINKYSQEQR